MSSVRSMTSIWQPVVEASALHRTAPRLALPYISRVAMLHIAAVNCVTLGKSERPSDQPSRPC